jgi:hypothetical protein
VILVSGGLQTFQSLATAGSGAFSSSEIYDFGKDSWSAGPDLPDFRSDGRAVTIRKRYLWLGGRSGASSSLVTKTGNVLEYDAAASQWGITTMVLASTASVPVVIPYNL